MRSMLPALLLAVTSAVAQSNDSACNVWPHWDRFKQLYVSKDGRVIDASTERQVTTSEGQSYALFFSLVANDPQAFASVLEWTENNLAQGDLKRALPAWQWGRASDGRWTVLDANAASDADLWIAYSLGEAGRLWSNASYAESGRALAQRILREETALVPRLGITLLPGPKGFVERDTWRLNASYLPLQVLRALAKQTDEVVWREVIKSSEQIIVASAPHGFAGDWIEYHNDGFAPDTATHGVGSYNAIRVYLWAGTLSDKDPARSKLIRTLEPMAASVARRAAPPETVDITTEAMQGEGSPGFSAAVLPLLTAHRKQDAVQKHRLRAEQAALQNDTSYYSDVLTLFGLGWTEGRYRFDAAGTLAVQWTKPCSAH